MMSPRPPIHPGGILAEALDAAGVSATERARAPALKPKGGGSKCLKAATQSRPARRAMDKARGLA